MSVNIEFKNISKRYGTKENHVLKNINLTINSGEFFVLVGPSGSGKTTLLRMLAGLEEITAGSILMDGKEINDIAVQDRNISMVFQNYALYPHMTVEENILFGLKTRKISKDEQKDRLKRTVNILGIDGLLRRKPKQLSGGQKQRVALARMAVSRMPLCLMDEPLSNLDMQLRTHMRREIKLLQQELNLTMIYVTHDQTEAMTMGDRICVLHDGQIQQVDTPINLYNQPANRFTAEFIGIPKMNIIKAEDLGMTTGYEVGIRPENVRQGGTYTVRVDSVEQLGVDTLLTFKFKDRILYAKWLGQHDINRGQEITIGFDVGNFHHFDENGIALY
ncbi:MULTISPECIES: ABC transporter ATP-binding protein [Jeotgalicoccus]|uniref:ABC transporter ATP-binding protein n=1 Tax=Jeotgalicoccus TaxID=227979 RepID=UPI000417D524|nr:MULTISPECIES: ABC transporter ATP-binding protein [Jeotgalicoccus]QQD84943.1 ABC transporter ATP-binding protein [Jeotgalicoccus sp. ATCC 8456]